MLSRYSSIFNLQINFFLSFFNFLFSYYSLFLLCLLNIYFSVCMSLYIFYTLFLSLLFLFPQNGNFVERLYLMWLNVINSLATRAEKLLLNKFVLWEFLKLFCVQIYVFKIEINQTGIIISGCLNEPYNNICYCILHSLQLLDNAL